MKKMLVLLLVLLSLASIAFAESTIDLSAMNEEELVSLRNSINAELATRNFAEKEVNVPPGTYTIGVDIPAGAYTLRTDSDLVSISIEDENGRFVSGHPLSKGEIVGKQPLEDGWTIEISYGSVIFKPYVGLGF